MWKFLSQTKPLFCIPGDEIELATNTTSSDIEVICSPVGESVKLPVSSPTGPAKQLTKTKCSRVKGNI